MFACFGVFALTRLKLEVLEQLCFLWDALSVFWLYAVAKNGVCHLALAVLQVNLNFKPIWICIWHQNSSRIPHQYFPPKLFFFEFLKCRKFQIVVAKIFPLCNENLNSFLTRLWKLFKGGNYWRGNTVFPILCTNLCWRLQLVVTRPFNGYSKCKSKIAWGPNFNVHFPVYIYVCD